MSQCSKNVDDVEHSYVNNIPVKKTTKGSIFNDNFIETKLKVKN